MLRNNLLFPVMLLYSPSWVARALESFTQNYDYDDDCVEPKVRHAC